MAALSCESPLLCYRQSGRLGFQDPSVANWFGGPYRKFPGLTVPIKQTPIIVACDSIGGRYL